MKEDDYYTEECVCDERGVTIFRATYLSKHGKQYNGPVRDSKVLPHLFQAPLFQRAACDITPPGASIFLVLLMLLMPNVAMIIKCLSMPLACSVFYSSGDCRHGPGVPYIQGSRAPGWPLRSLRGRAAPPAGPQRHRGGKRHARLKHWVWVSESSSFLLNEAALAYPCYDGFGTCGPT